MARAEPLGPETQRLSHALGKVLGGHRRRPSPERAAVERFPSAPREGRTALPAVCDTGRVTWRIESPGRTVPAPGRRVPRRAPTGRPDGSGGGGCRRPPEPCGFQIAPRRKSVELAHERGHQLLQFEIVPIELCDFIGVHRVPPRPLRRAGPGTSSTVLRVRRSGAGLSGAGRRAGAPCVASGPWSDRNSDQGAPAPDSAGPRADVRKPDLGSARPNIIQQRRNAEMMEA